jgi:hypothetical protein
MKYRIAERNILILNKKMQAGVQCRGGPQPFRSCGFRFPEPEPPRISDGAA